MSAKKKQKSPRWVKLDNAAKIYPAARSREWSNVFRLSATLTEPVDRKILAEALTAVVKRFPSMATRLRRGAFWYYLEELSAPPEIRDENAFPLERMYFREMRKCALRVIVYNRRIAVEIFHALTDGTGALIFLKTLVAQYLSLRYGIDVPAECGILSVHDDPTDRELEDSFLKCCGKVSASRSETDAFRVRGTRYDDEFLNLTCFRMKTRQLLDIAHGYGVTLTALVGAIMLKALIDLQNDTVRDPSRHKNLKVLIPVNLRPLFGSGSLRNFAMYTIPEVDPRLGEYTVEELCRIVHHKMGLDVTAKNMSRMITTNVKSELSLIVRVMPLAVKNFVMKAVFNAVGERKSCLSLSNLGRVTLPDVISPYVERFDFILGVQATAPYNCGLISYGDTACLNFIRNIREPKLESRFYSVLRDLGIDVEVESNYSEEHSPLFP